jgi:alpha-tubulin suppressor-like RCC1 family protein
MISRLATLFTTAVVLCTLSCQSEKDSYVVLHTDVNCDVPRVYQLRVTVVNPGTPEFQKIVPEAAAGELGFPNTLVLILPSSRSGAIQVQVEAIDNKFTLVGSGTISGQIVAGGRIDLTVQLGALGSAPASSGSVDGGKSGDPDAGTTGPSGSTAGGGVPFAQVAVGKDSTCAVRLNGSLWCWGSNTYGQLLLPSTFNRLTPVAVGGAAWNQVACGQSHSCGVSNQATLSCWGNNGSGQLGALPASAEAGQADVPGGPWQSVAAGLYQTCAIKQDGTLWCWGDNTNGTLGTSDTNSSAVPIQVTGQGWSQVSANYLHACAVKTDGTLWCWGLNANLEVGTKSQFPWLPVQLSGTWTQVTTGLYHSCATKPDGTLWCWGGNLSGQLGNDSIPVLPTSQTSDPVQVAGTTWQSVSAGQSHTCAIMLDGTLWCWGSNSSGQLGDNTVNLRSTPVAVVTSGQTWAMVVAGVTHTCALATGGSLWCWGDNSAGQLGIGSNDLREIPTRVAQ